MAIIRKRVKRILKRFSAGKRNRVAVQSRATRLVPIVRYLFPMILDSWNQSFRQVHTFCMFLGYERSGHTLVGALLDAHPNAAVAIEANALEYIKLGVTRAYLYSILLHRSREFLTEDGAEWWGYQYDVPGQWQGRFSELFVMGDKKGGSTTRLLGESPNLLNQLRRTLGADTVLRVIHVIRNPYDNISTIARREQKPITQALIESFFGLWDTVLEVIPQLDEKEFYTVRHENFVSDPKKHLRELCEFLQLDCPQDYVEAAASIVNPSPNKSRYSIEWPTEMRKLVDNHISENPYLKGYSFDGT